MNLYIITKNMGSSESMQSLIYSHIYLTRVQLAKDNKGLYTNRSVTFLVLHTMLIHKVKVSPFTPPL